MVSIVTSSCVSCNQVGCLRCDIADTCAETKPGFVIENGQAKCPSGSPLNSNNECVVCSVSGCSSCLSANVCESCLSGLNFVSGKCVCPNSLETFSQTQLACVSCNQVGCLRCDIADTCS